MHYHCQCLCFKASCVRMIAFVVCYEISPTQVHAQIVFFKFSMVSEHRYFYKHS